MSQELNDALAQIKIVESRLSNVESALSSGSSVNNTSNDAIESALNAYKLQILDKLKSIRAALISEGGDIQSVRNERDTAIKENAQLKIENERLNYRVRHLVRALNEEESKNIK